MAAVRAAAAAGVQRVIIGTAAMEQPELVEQAASELPGRVAVGIDARDGLVAPHGWKVLTDVRAADLAKRMEATGASAVIYTDIGRDGMLAGPNVAETAVLAQSLTIPVIASGGVSSLKDVEVLASLSSTGVAGIIIGRALYAGRFTLPEALDAARGSKNAPERS